MVARVAALAVDGRPGRPAVVHPPGRQVRGGFHVPARAPRGLRIAHGRTRRSPSRALHALASGPHACGGSRGSPKRKRGKSPHYQLPCEGLPFRRKTDPLPPHRGIRPVPPHGPHARSPPRRPGVGLPVREGGVQRRPSGRRREFPWQQRSPALLRDWFGPDAGLPGTNFEVEFTSVDGAWSISPVSRREENGACHHLPDAAGDPAPAAGRGLQTNGGWHPFPAPSSPPRRPPPATPPTSRSTTSPPRRASGDRRACRRRSAGRRCRAWR